MFPGRRGRGLPFGCLLQGAATLSATSRGEMPSEGPSVMASQQTRADRIDRSLKRLGFHLSRTRRTFRITDNAGALAVNSTAAMTLEEIERWNR